MEAAEKKETLPGLCDVYAGWGNFLCKLSRRFGHQFSQSDCFIVTSCWVWGIYTHLSLRGCFQSRLRIWFYKCFSKIITRPLPAIQTRQGLLYSGRWLNCQAKNRGELSSASITPRLRTSAYNRCCVYGLTYSLTLLVTRKKILFNCQQL